MVKRADIVVVDFPFVSGAQSKKRPALVIQCDRDNNTLQTTIVAMLSGNIKLAGKVPTQILVDPSTPDGISSNLTFPSVVKCNNLYTVSQSNILKTIGRLSDALMQQVDAALKDSQGLK